MSQHRIAFGALVGGAVGFWFAEQFAEYYRVRARGRRRKEEKRAASPARKKRQLRLFLDASALRRNGSLALL